MTVYIHPLYAIYSCGLEFGTNSALLFWLLLRCLLATRPTLTQRFILTVVLATCWHAKLVLTIRMVVPAFRHALFFMYDPRIFTTFLYLDMRSKQASFSRRFPFVFPKCSKVMYLVVLFILMEGKRSHQDRTEFPMLVDAFSIPQPSQPGMSMSIQVGPRGIWSQG